MVLGSLMGSAYAAYSYNQGRFQFDAGQKQTSAHQMINMRIQQWQLFREDIRDLFNLTTSHMSTYMVIGTLFLGFSVSFIWYCPTFPGHPAWLKLLWVNTSAGALCYSFLAVWLAMHGAIAAQSASVQLLTRAIRPPYPTAMELQRVQHQLAQYEAAPSKFFRPPNLLGQDPPGQDVPSPGHDPQNLTLRSTVNSTTGAAQVVDASAEEAAQGMGAVQQGSGCSDPTNPWESEPGLSAELGVHVKLFQQLQNSFLPFDAYARVCLIACASNLMPALTYFWIAHQSWTDPGAMLATVICSGALMFTTLVLYKLDFYVEKQRMRIYKAVVVCAPLVSCAAVQSWAHARHVGGDWHVAEELIQWLLVLATCLLHILWKLLFIWEARPSKEDLDLPMSFRSVRYLDIFGSLRRRQADERRRFEQALRQRMPESQNDVDSSEPSGHLSAEQVLGMIERVLLINQSSEQDQDILRSDEVQTLQRCRERLLALGPGLSAEEPDLEIWFQREITTGTRRPLVFYINLDTFETAWAPGAPHLDIATLLREVERLTGSRRERNRQSRQSARGMQRFEVEGAERQVPPSDDGRSSLVDTMSAAQRPFLPTMRRPGSSHEQSSMPWKYFMQITLSLIMAWLVTTVYCLVHPDTGTKTRLMQVTSWPHDFFEPAAMSCAGDQLFLGDRFGMYASQMAATGGEPGRFEAAQLEIGPEPEQSGKSGHGHMPWAPFASMAALKSGPTELLVLQHDGRVIWELHRNYNKIWNISLRLPEPVRAIAVIAESVADRECAGYGEQPWGVLASSWAGETLVLCPKEGTLHPRRRISKMEVHGRMVETIGMHLTSTSLWVLAKSVDDGSSWLVRQARSGAKDIHQLPQGRSWATGLCGRSNASEEPDTILLAGLSLTRGIPELWQVRPMGTAGLQFLPG